MGTIVGIGVSVITSISAVVSSQTISVSVSKSVVSTGVTVVSTIEDSGVSFGFGFSLTAFTASSTRNGNISGVNTGGRFYSSDSSNSSAIGTIGISVVSTIVSSQTVVASQTISVTITTISINTGMTVVSSIEDSGVSLSFSLTVDGGHEGGDNCN